MFATAATLSIVLTLLLAVLGGAKMLRHPMMVKEARHLGFSVQGFQIVGALEVAGAAGLVTGLFWAPLGVAASTGLVLLLIGATIVHARARDRFATTAPAVLCAILSAVTLVLFTAV